MNIPQFRSGKKSHYSRANRVAKREENKVIFSKLIFRVPGFMSRIRKRTVFTHVWGAQLLTNKRIFAPTPKSRKNSLVDGSAPLSCRNRRPGPKLLPQECQGLLEEVAPLVVGNRLRAQPETRENRRWPGILDSGDRIDRGGRDTVDGIVLFRDSKGCFTK